MPEHTQGAQMTVEQRIEKMDRDLKEHFVEMRDFTSSALLGLEKRLTERIDGVEQRLTGRIDGIDLRIDGVEKRLGDRIDGVELRLDKLERNVKAGFQVVDSRLRGLDAKVDESNGMLRKLLRQRTAGPARRARRRGR